MLLLRTRSPTASSFSPSTGSSSGCVTKTTLPATKYRLTAEGRDLRTIIVGLLQWGDRWPDFDEPPVTLVSGTTGDRLDPSRLTTRRLRPRPRGAVRR
ncbi:MAG: winged helix-turn-helix transcriptional regulator [Acidimicrobiales bacterium]